jgi:hypothetical protein
LNCAWMGAMDALHLKLHFRPVFWNGNCQDTRNRRSGADLPPLPHRMPQSQGEDPHAKA